MKVDKLGRRDFIKYGLISSCLALSGCSASQKKSVLRGVPNTFPSEVVESLPRHWKFVPIKNIESKTDPYNLTLYERTDLLVLNDGWISDLPYRLFQEIKAKSIRKNLNNQAKLFLDGLGENYKNKILPLAVSPWVIVFRNEDSLSLKNKNSWKVILSDTLTDQIVFPSSPYLLISIAKKTGFFNDFARFKNQAKSFDDRNALNWVISGRAKAAVLPLSSCVDSLIKDPRLSVLLPDEGSPLSWTVFASPSSSSESFSSYLFDLLWESTHSRSVIRKGFLPPTTFSNFRNKDINISERYQSVFLPKKSVWKNCWSLPILNVEDKKELALYWNNA
tara:strand:+ start:1569 stop:2570 length:1002 start_codon:yes stop_codon:yes gene_type:complete